MSRWSIHYRRRKGTERACFARHIRYARMFVSEGLRIKNPVVAAVYIFADARGSELTKPVSSKVCERIEAEISNLPVT